MKRIAAILLLSLFFLTMLTACGGDKWPESGLGALLPSPKSGSISIIINDKDEFYASVDSPSTDEYNKYISICKEKGFTIDADSDSYSFSAFNEDGYKVDLSDYSKSFNIDIEAPMILDEIRWPKSDIGAVVPKPESTKGKIEQEDEDGFSVYIGDTTIEQYQDYVDKCFDSGFNIDYEKSDKHFSGNNKENYSLNIDYLGFNIIKIDAEKGDEAPETKDSSKETDKPKETEKEKETKKDNKEKKSDLSGKDVIRDDIKEAIDSYEEFIDEYCEFMENYDSSDYTQITEYAELIAKELEATQKFEAIEDEELTDAEAVYYAEVSLRCSEKLLKSSQY